MQNNSKLNTVLLVLVIILLGFGIWMLAEKKAGVASPGGYTQTNDNLNGPDYFPNNDKPAPTTTVDWKSMKSEIVAALKLAFPQTISNTSNAGLILRDDVDLTGDGIPEALVYNGEQGAYISITTIARIENGKVVISYMKQKDGPTSPVILEEGASVMNQLYKGLDAADGAFYQVSVSANTENGDLSCRLDAYKWNPATKLFEYSASVSNKLEPTECNYYTHPQG